MKDGEPIGRDTPQDETTAAALAKHFGMPVIDLVGFSPSDELLRTINPDIAKRYRVLPIRQRNDILTVAIGDPMDFDTLESIRHILKTNVEAVYCSPVRLRQAIEHYYGRDPT